MAILLLSKISDWFKYERVRQYPAASAFDKPEALKRLRAYEREERDACQPWFNYFWFSNWLFFVLWFVLAN